MGSKYEVYVRSPAPSHMQTIEQTFRTLTNKVRGIYFVKEVFLRFPSYSCVCLWYCVVVMLNDDVDDYITIGNWLIFCCFLSASSKPLNPVSRNKASFGIQITVWKMLLYKLYCTFILVRYMQRCIIWRQQVRWHKKLWIMSNNSTTSNTLRLENADLRKNLKSENTCLESVS